MTDLRKVFAERVQALAPETVVGQENFPEMAHAALTKDFEDRYGMAPGEANGLFRDQGLFKTLMEHLYLTTMDQLRDCDLREAGPGIQAQAQLCWELLNLPTQISEITRLEMES